MPHLEGGCRARQAQSVPGCRHQLLTFDSGNRWVSCQPLGVGCCLARWYALLLLQHVMTRLKACLAACIFRSQCSCQGEALELFGSDCYALAEMA